MSRRFERVDEDLKARRVSGQLEQSHDAYNTEELENVAVLLKLSEQEVEIERQCGDQVDDVDRRQYERSFARTDDESHEKFKREPCITRAFNQEKRAMRFRLALVQHPS